MIAGIQNRKELDITPLRKDALDILEEGYKAIDTEKVIFDAVSINDHTLVIQDQTFPLDEYDRIHLIGFGKASCEASAALEKVLGAVLHTGIAIDVEIEPQVCEIVQTYRASHPRPSKENVEIAQKVVDFSGKLNERDLVIVNVSGGGSSLLCWPMSECDQGTRLYETFLGAGGTITELNVIRKHISGLKGGGLAQKLYPATVVGLVFSDVPGGDLSYVASGPTFYDETTVEDAQEILDKYNITETFDLTETPKDKVYFEKVHNIGLVTNEIAFDVMRKKADELGYSSKLISPRMYDSAEETLDEFWNKTDDQSVSFGGGEITLVVDKKGGSGGRNLYLANAALERITNENEIFIASASDGIDNCPIAGGIADYETLKKIKEKDLDFEEYLDNFDSQRLFEATGDAIVTGSTGANVADFMMYLKK